MRGAKDRRGVTAATGFGWYKEKYGASAAIAGIAAALVGTALPAAAQTTVAGVTPGALAVDAQGQANYSIPIDVPPGIAGMEPSLSLNYSSGAGNGIAGVGWSLGGLSAITRCPRTPAQDGQWGGIEYTDDDRFCLDGKRLVAVNGVYGADGTEYRTEIDGFFRIVSYGKVTGSTGLQGTSPVWFRVWTKSGQVMDYGASEDSRIEAVFTPAPAPEAPPEVRAWAVGRIADTVGNYMIFSYFEDPIAGAHRLDRIDYTYNDAAGVAAQSSVQLVYEARPDVASGYPGGSLITSDMRLAAVRTFTDGAPVRDYRLAYETGAATGRSRLLSVTECDGANVCLEPTAYSWGEVPAGTPEWLSSPNFIPPENLDAGSRLLDINSDGLPDLLYHRSSGVSGAYLNAGDGWISIPEYAPPATLEPGASVRFVDLNGDSLPDFVKEATAYLNTGSGWQPAPQYNLPYSVVASFQGQGNKDSGARFADLDGDGLLDYSYFSRLNYTYHYLSITTTTTDTKGTFLNTGSGWAASAEFVPPYPLRINETYAIDFRIFFGTGIGYSHRTIFSGAEYNDLNGDGRADYYYNLRYQPFSLWQTTQAYVTQAGSHLNTGAGWAPAPAFAPPYHTAEFNGYGTFDSAGDTGVRVVDLNGDNLLDFVWAHNGVTNAGAYLNTGAGWEWSVGYLPPYEFAEDAQADTGARLADVNADGRPDFVYNRSTGGTNPNGAYLNTGSGWSPANEYAPPEPLGIDGVADSGVRLADLNGDGLVDFAFKGSSSGAYLNTRTAELISAVTDSLGANTTLSYAPLTDPALYEKFSDAVFPVQDVQGSIYVISKVERDDGAGGTARTTYRYAGAKTDTTGRGFLGFRAMEATDEQTGIVTTTTYAQDFPFIGQVEATETFVPDPSGATAGTMLGRTTNTLAQKPLNLGASVFPYVSQTVAESFEASDGPGNAAVVTTTTASSYDDYGNPTLVTVATAGGGESFATTTTNIYTNDAVNWFLARLTRATVTNTLPDLRSATRVSAFAYDPATGLLTQEVVEPGDPALALVTDYGHDAFGHRTSVTVSGADIATRTTTTDYPAAAPNSGRFATNATNALGHTETRTYDARFGTVGGLTGPNGITTSWQYDGFGRKLLESRSDGTETRWSYELCTAQCPAGAVHAAAVQTFLSAAGTPIDARKVAYFDALNRSIRGETQGFDGTPVYADTVFDALGRVERVSRPYFAGTPAGEIRWTVTTYDAIGRPATVTAPDGGVESMAYDGLTTIATNALGQSETRVENAIGQLARSVDDEGNSVLNGYDAFGNLERSEVLPAGADPGTGVVTTMTYDIRGRKRAMDDPDMGLWTYDYDVLGQLVRQTDAKAQAVTMQYDLLGRMTLRSEAEGTTSWSYDSPLKTAAIGKPDRVSRSQDDYVEDYTYDSLGRPLETAVTFEGRAYATTTAYDGAGRPALLTYPAAGDGSRFAVENVYTALGHLAAVQEPGGLGTVYWRADSVDAEGRVTAETLGNGLVTQRDFDAASGLVQAIRVFDGLTAIKDQGFAFDHIGNLTSRTDALRNRREDFTYDGLNRVTAATVTDTATLAQLSQATTAYDALGNITFKSDVGGYLYNGVDGGPHAVTQAGDTTYRYDANGSMVSSEATVGGAIIRTVTWSSFHKPVRIEGAGGAVASEFTYGPGRARVKQTLFEGVTAVKAITYLGAFERHAVPGQADELVHYIAAGGTVAIYTKVDDGSPATDRMRYLHRDHLGSVDLVTDGAGLVAETRSFDPWGRARSADWTPATGELPLAETKRGFTGHEHLDSVGLVHMNGRVYDPVIGRMLSADPIVQAPTATQSHNRYSYVMNNPLSFTDPSGFFLKGLLKAAGMVGRAIGRVARKLVRAALATPVGQVGGQILFNTILPGPLGAAAFSAISTAVSGGDLGDILSAATISFVAAAAHNAVGEHFSHQADFLSSNHVSKTIAHGLVGGTASVARGGKFASGFLGSSVGEFAAPMVRNMPGGVPAQAMADAVVGGGAAALGGGKFADGAMSAAFVYLYNEAALAAPEPDGSVTGVGMGTGRIEDLEAAHEEALYIMDGIVFVATVPFQTIGAGIRIYRGYVNAARMAKVVNLGRVGEDAVRAAYDIGPTRAIRVNGRMRVPDGVTELAVSEVKNVARQGWTRQLQDYAAHAGQTGLDFNLYVRSTTQLSRAVQSAHQEGLVNVIYY